MGQWSFKLSLTAGISDHRSTQNLKQNKNTASVHVDITQILETHREILSTQTRNDKHSISKRRVNISHVHRYSGYPGIRRIYIPTSLYLPYLSI